MIILFAPAPATMWAHPLLLKNLLLPPVLSRVEVDARGEEELFTDYEPQKYLT